MDPSSLEAAGGISSFGTAYSVFAIVVILGGLIFFHELGHFLAAKSFRIGVKTFSLGFGPKILGFKRGTTQYQVAAIPLGGFVSMVGESDPNDIPEPFTVADSFSIRPVWQRFIVIAAGPIFNLLLAWFLYWGVFFAHGQEFILPQAGEVQENSPAMQAGLVSGDTILAINGTPITQWDELLAAVMESNGAPLVLSIDREGQLLERTATPRPITRETIFGETTHSWAIGLGPSYAKGTRQFSFWESSGKGFFHGIFVTKLIGKSLVKMVERVVPLDSVGGPLRIAKEIHTQTQSGSIFGLMMLAAFISLNLGLLNLLPIPVLDGGHLIFLIFESIRRKPAPERLQEITAGIGVAFLLFLMVFVTYNDISKWIQGKL